MQKTGRYILPVILGVYLLLVMPLITADHDWGDDFASYLMQARSIVEQSIPDFIQSNTFTIQHSTITLGPVVYPWGFPLLIAPFYPAFGFDLYLIKMLNVVSYFTFLILVFFLFKDRLSIHERWILTGLFAFSPTILNAHNQILSDLPFLLFSTFSIFLINLAYPPGRNVSRNWMLSLGIGIAIFCSFFVRTNGFLLLITLLLVQITSYWIYPTWHNRLSLHASPTVSNKQRSEIHEPTTKSQPLPLHLPHNHRIPLIKQDFWVLMLPYLCTAVLYYLSSLWFPSGGSGYLEQLSRSSLETIFHHIFLNGLVLNTFWHTGGFLSPLNIVLTIITGAVALVGFWRNALKDGLFTIHFSLTFLLYMIVPSLQGLRFLLPVAPFNVYFIFKGFEIINSCMQQKTSWWKSRLSTAFQLCLAVILFAQALVLSTNQRFGLHAMEGPYDPVSTEMFTEISSQTEPDSVVLFFKPRLMHLITNRASFYSSSCTDLGLADYLVEKRYEKLMPVTDCEQDFNLSVIFENQRFLIYHVEPKH